MQNVQRYGKQYGARAPTQISLKSLDWFSIDLHALRMLSVSHSVLVLTVEIGFEAHSLPTNIDSISCEDIVYGLKSTWK